MTQLFRPGIIVALYALLLPVFGPLLDHHFVEWQHDHAHVYFDGPARGGGPVHRHVYETAGSHLHRTVAPNSPEIQSGGSFPGSTGEDSRPGGIAYITSYDGAGSSLVYAPAGPAAESLRFPDPGDSPLLRGYSPRDIPPPGVFTAPPRKPPRT